MKESEDIADNHDAPENKEEEQPTESISTYVNQEYVKQLMEMGFSKSVAEKSLFFTLSQGGTTEKALDWISQHSDDADFNEELRVVGYKIVLE